MDFFKLCTIFRKVISFIYKIFYLSARGPLRNFADLSPHVESVHKREASPSYIIMFYCNNYVD